MAIKREITNHGLWDVESCKSVVMNDYRVWRQFSVVPNSICATNGALALNQPYRLEEGRLMNVVQGKIRMLANLQEYQLASGDVLLLPPNCIIELLEMSSDARIQALSYNDDAFSVKIHEVVHISTQEDEQEQVKLIFRLIWLALGQQPVIKPLVEHLFQALQSLIIGISKREREGSLHTAQSRQQMLFQRFLLLVHENCTEERGLFFYADKLVITPHYLSTMVKQFSGVNASTWINRAVCLEAKIRLRHSHQLISQISDELNFPNPAFFNRFFKRETGLTPGEYRNSGINNVNK